jgi:hypothetical protein
MKQREHNRKGAINRRQLVDRLHKVSRAALRVELRKNLPRSLRQFVLAWHMPMYIRRKSAAVKYVAKSKFVRDKKD